MCGIAGYYGTVSNSRTFLDQSIEDLKHRGPDGEGIFELEWAGISHCRLALISPGESGAQPIETSRYVLTFNGEIYNWKELAVELRSYASNTDLSSDGKVLIHSIETWGIDLALQKFRGIFAFAILDKLKKELLLARDSAGTKPLYYIQRAGTTYFSSEVKVFSKLGLDLDLEQLNEYLTFQNFIGAKCIFKDVYLVEAGTYLIFKHPDANPSAILWDPGFFSSESDYSEEEALDGLENLLEQALKRNLVADFQIGMFLSSGLDSSTISILASRKNLNAKTFTVGFAREEFNNHSMFKDEREIAAGLAKTLGLQNFNLEISASDLERDFDRLCWSIEEPRVGQSYPNYFASALAKKHEKSVLSGAGGDELFGGYPWRYMKTLELKQLGKNAQLDEYFKIWHRLGEPEVICKMLGLNEPEHIQAGKNKILNILNLNSKNKNYFDLQDLLFFEYKTFLQGLLLVDDKISMSHGLEVRVPFLDQDLVRFAQKLPNNLRIDSVSTFKNNSEAKEVQGKKLLRSLAGRIQNPVQFLPKTGFSGPDESWFRNESRSFVSDRLLDRKSQIWDNLDFQTGSKLVMDHLNGTSNNRLLVWSLLSLESTIRQFKL